MSDPAQSTTDNRSPAECGHVTLLKGCRCHRDRWIICDHPWFIGIIDSHRVTEFHNLADALAPYPWATAPREHSDALEYTSYVKAAIERGEEVDFTVPALRECLCRNLQLVWQVDRSLGSVYFVVDSDMVKIGWATNLNARFISLQSGNSRPLRLAAAIIGDRSTENYLQSVFKEYWVCREWFRHVGRLKNFTTDIADRPCKVQLPADPVQRKSRRRAAVFPRLSPRSGQR